MTLLALEEASTFPVLFLSRLLFIFFTHVLCVKLYYEEQDKSTALQRDICDLLYALFVFFLSSRNQWIICPIEESFQCTIPTPHRFSSKVASPRETLSEIYVAGLYLYIQWRTCKRLVCMFCFSLPQMRETPFVAALNFLLPRFLATIDILLCARQFYRHQ